MFPCLIINLPERTDRRAHAEREIQKLPHNSFEFVTAIRDKTCFLSHRKCIEIAKQNNWPYVCILEDDFTILEDIVPELTAAIMQLAGREWGILYFGANLQGPAYQVSENLLRLTSAYALHAYLVNSTLYDEILAIPYGQEMDVAINEKIIPNFPCFVINPMVGYQVGGHSDLQHTFRDYTSELNYNFRRFAQQNESSYS